MRSGVSPCAGQAVVQFCRGIDDRHYAIKFFLDHDAFLTEASLFAACFPYLRSTVSPLVGARADATIEAADSDTSISNVPLSQFAARFLPQVEALCDSTAKDLVDPRGRAMPPCIIMEKGESLQDWSNRAEPDLFTALAVRSPSFRCLARILAFFNHWTYHTSRLGPVTECAACALFFRVLHESHAWQPAVGVAS